MRYYDIRNFDTHKFVIFTENYCMNVAQILNRVEDFNVNRNYWFVRTDYGKNFDEFYKQGYIGIG